MKLIWAPRVQMDLALFWVQVYHVAHYSTKLETINLGPKEGWYPNMPTTFIIKMVSRRP
jgi:hypothetical protein